jgi:hypothetical protein
VDNDFQEHTTRSTQLFVFCLDFKPVVVQLFKQGDIGHFMRTILRWFGIVLILVAVAFFIASGQVVDIPGPVETAKSNYIVTHSLRSIIISSALALVGATVFARNFRSKV